MVKLKMSGMCLIALGFALLLLTGCATGEYSQVVIGGSNCPPRTELSESGVGTSDPLPHDG